MLPGNPEVEVPGCRIVQTVESYRTGYGGTPPQSPGAPFYATVAIVHVIAVKPIVAELSRVDR
ncbi:hypothetical protein I6E81_04995 [Salinibacterium sp. NG22]|uniref:hypothetical protein n=1 Tax=Salinibacterium sp. NG22 TaxID=2792040 RepID=UPI0018CD6F1C|nr:hypothetical protein [Salinibacterium sp. NG22]MBH0109514.1 hypothetical protein [Salinibacterium sp. NG22]